MKQPDEQISLARAARRIRHRQGRLLIADPEDAFARLVGGRQLLIAAGANARRAQRVIRRNCQRRVRNDLELIGDHAGPAQGAVQAVAAGERQRRPGKGGNQQAG